MQRVYLAENNIEAYLVQGLLEGEGLECEIHGEYLPGGAGLLPAAGTVELWVPVKQEAAARDLLRRYEQGEFAEHSYHEQFPDREAPDED